MAKCKSNINSGVLCMIDANYNRAKEGLRVVEDVVRFVKNNRKLMCQIKGIRHALTGAISTAVREAAIAERDSQSDCGRPSDQWEMQRSSVGDILYANMQRVKESLRVLEECMKLFDRKAVRELKESRYAMYELEKDIFRVK